jgi:hypothetical protein
MFTFNALPHLVSPETVIRPGMIRTLDQEKRTMVRVPGFEPGLQAWEA